MSSKQIDGVEIIDTNKDAEEVTLYTEDVEIHRLLAKINPQGATYERSGRVFGWSHRIGSEKLRGLAKALKNPDRRASETSRIDGDGVSGRQSSSQSSGGPA